MWNFDDRHNSWPRDFQELVSIFLFKTSMGVRFWLNRMNLTPMEEYIEFASNCAAFEATEVLKSLISGKRLDDQQYYAIVKSARVFDSFKFLIEHRTLTDEQYFDLAKKTVEENNIDFFVCLVKHTQFNIQDLNYFRQEASKRGQIEIFNILNQILIDEGCGIDASQNAVIEAKELELEGFALDSSSIDDSPEGRRMKQVLLELEGANFAVRKLAIQNPKLIPTSLEFEDSAHARDSDKLKLSYGPRHFWMHAVFKCSKVAGFESLYGKSEAMISLFMDHAPRDAEGNIDPHSLTKLALRVLAKNPPEKSPVLNDEIWANIVSYIPFDFIDFSGRSSVQSDDYSINEEKIEKRADVVRLVEATQDKSSVCDLLRRHDLVEEQESQPVEMPPVVHLPLAEDASSEGVDGSAAEPDFQPLSEGALIGECKAEDTGVQVSGAPDEDSYFSDTE